MSKDTFLDLLAGNAVHENEEVPRLSQTGQGQLDSEPSGYDECSCFWMLIYVFKGTSNLGICLSRHHCCFSTL